MKLTSEPNRFIFSHYRVQRSTIPVGFASESPADGTQHLGAGTGPKGSQSG